MINGAMITIAGGGGGGTSLGSGVSGIISLNSQTGPDVNIISLDSSIDISASSNLIDISCSGFVSGIQSFLLDEIITVHNDLNGLQGGTTDEYYHLTATEYNTQFGLPVSGQILLQLIEASSGIVAINNERGPEITHQSADNTIDITVSSANIIDHSCSGFVSGVNVVLEDTIIASGQLLLDEIANIDAIKTINGEDGPAITFSSIDGSIAINTTTDNIDVSCSGYASSGFVERIDFDWNGFFNRTDSEIAFEHETRTFSITPTAASYQYYVDGIRYTNTTGDSLVIPTGTEGVYYIYYDDDILTSVLNPNAGQISSLIRTKALVSAVQWSDSQNSGIYIGEERHGKNMSSTSHAYHHFDDGLVYLYPGLGLNDITADGDGDLDTSAVFGIDAGSVADEDIFIAIDAVSSGIGLPVYYMTGSTPNWNRTDPSGFSVRTLDTTSNTRLAYNEFTGSEWKLTEVTNNDFVLCHVFATTEKDNPMIAFMGQDSYVNIARARQYAELEILSLITNDILLPEIRPIATVIFETSNGHDNQVKARIRTTDDGENYIDWRSETISRGVISTSDHNSLTNLQGGAVGQYYHLTETERTRALNATNKYFAFFTNSTGGTITHGLGTNFITYDVYASGTSVDSIIPDRLQIIDEDNINIVFNRPQTGFITIIG